MPDAQMGERDDRGGRHVEFKQSSSNSSDTFGLGEEKSQELENEGEREDEWDARIRTLLSRAATPLPSPPPPRPSPPLSPNPMPPPQLLHIPAFASCGEEESRPNVQADPRVTANTSASLSAVDVTGAVVSEKCLPRPEAESAAMAFNREPTTLAGKRRETDAATARKHAEDIRNNEVEEQEQEEEQEAEEEEDPLLAAETAERELLSGGTDIADEVSGSGDAVTEALDALKPFTTQPTPRESAYAGVLRLRDAHKQLSLAIVGNVQGKPSSVALGPGGSMAVGTTNGIVIVSRPEITAPRSSLSDHPDAEGHGEDAVKEPKTKGRVWYVEPKTKITTLGVPVPGATITSLAFCANSGGAGFYTVENWLLAGHGDGRMVLWDVMRGTVVKELPGAHQSSVIAAALVSPVMSAAAVSAALANVDDGEINATKSTLKANIEGSVGIHAARLGSVGLTGAAPVEALSASLSGTVSRHTLTSIGPLVRAKVSCLGERTAVLQFQPLPLLFVPPRDRSSEGVPPDTSAAHTDALGVIALVTSTAIIVMRLHPEAGVLTKLSRPSASSSADPPCFAWAPRVIGRNASKESQTHMVVSWGLVIQLLELDIAAAMHVAPSVASNDRSPQHRRQAAMRLRQEMRVEAPVVALAWLTGEIIVAVLTTNRLIVVSSRTGDVIEALSSWEAPERFATETPTDRDTNGHQSNDEDRAEGLKRARAQHAAVAAQGNLLALLSRSRQCLIRQIRVMGWRERMSMRCAEGNWGGAFAAALNASRETAPSLRRSPDVSSLPSGAADAALDLLPRFIASVLRRPKQPTMTDFRNADVTSTADADRTHAIHVTRAVIAVCRAADGLDRLHSSDVYDVLVASPHCKAAFLELIVTHVLAGGLSSLPPEVMQHLVDHFVHLGRPAVIEQCVLRMDATSLDVNQCARMCKKHRLFSAFAHVYNGALDDFIVPACALIDAAAADAAADIAAAFDARNNRREDGGPSTSAAEGPDDARRRGPARKLLLYLREVLRGQRFPPGRGTLPAARVGRIRAELLGFLLAPTASVEPSPFPGSRLSSARDAVCTPGLVSAPVKVRRRWRGCDINGAAGLVGVLWDAAGLADVIDDSTGDVPFRHRLPQRLAFLLGAEPSTTLDILTSTLKEWDATESECFEAAGVVLDGPAGGAGEDRLVSQVVVDCAIAAAEAFRKAATSVVVEKSSLENCGGSDAAGCEGDVAEAAAMACTRLLQFVGKFVSGGRATLTGVSRVQETLLLEALALGPPRSSSAAERAKLDSAMVAVLSRRVPSLTSSRASGESEEASRSPDADLDIDTVPIETTIQLARRAGFHQAEAMCHMMHADHLAALRALATDPQHPVGVLRYTDALLGTNFCGGRCSTVLRDDSDDAASHARLLLSDQAESFRACLLEALPLLAAAAPDPASYLGVTTFSASQEAVLDAFSDEPSLQYRYLRGVFSGAAASVDDAGNVKSCARLGISHADCAAHAHDDAAVAGDIPAASDTVCLSALIARAGTVVTELATERYIYLMCQFEPHRVKRFLQESPCGYHLKRCLTNCRHYNVSDAEAYLRERMGSAENALALSMSVYSSHLKDAVRRLILENREDQNNMFAAVDATHSSASITPSVLHSPSSDPFQVGIRDVVVAALGACTHNSSKRAWQEGNGEHAADATEARKMLVAVLNAVIEPLRQVRAKGWRRPLQAGPENGTSGMTFSTVDSELTASDGGGPSTHTPDSSPVSLRIALEAHACVIVDTMTKFGVDSPVTLSALLADKQNDAFGDFRLVLLDLMDRLATEVELLNNARRCVASDVLSSISHKLLATNRGSAQKNIVLLDPGC